MSDEKQELIIAVYLNQRIVFDLIAMLQDGMSTVTRVSTSEESKESDATQYGTTFGLSQALSSLLRIDVSGSRNKSKEGAAGTQRSEERVHTPSSLFQKLRSTLKTDEKIIVVNNSYRPTAGDIVEFSSALRRNPLVEGMEAFLSVLDVVITFTDQQFQPASGQQHKKPVLRKDPQQEVKSTKAQMETILGGLKAGKTIDIVSDELENGYRALITLDKEFLSDPGMADLVDGYFKIVGKVVRVISNSDESISFLRKAPLGAMSRQHLELAFSQFSVAAASAFNLPEMEFDVSGPLIQVIPIAIFA